MATMALLNEGDELLIPLRIPLWTATTALSGGTRCTTGAIGEMAGCPTR